MYSSMALKCGGPCTFGPPHCQKVGWPEPHGRRHWCLLTSVLIVISVTRAYETFDNKNVEKNFYSAQHQALHVQGRLPYGAMDIIFVWGCFCLKNEHKTSIL